MLVLSRKIGQKIVVPHCELSVSVLGIDGNTVRLGVSAPEQIGIYREELWERVRTEACSFEPIATRAAGASIPDPAPSPVGSRS